MGKKEEVKKKEPIQQIDPNLAIQIASQAITSADALEDDMMTSEEAMAKIAMKLADTPDEQVLSEYKGVEVILWTALKSVYTKFNVPLGLALTKNFGRYRVSLDRKGRQELSALARATKDEIDNKNKLKKLLTMGRG